MLTDIRELQTNDRIRFSFNNGNLRLLEPYNIDNVKLTITDISGKIYNQYEIEYLEINIDYPTALNLPSGIYLCKIIAGDKEFTQKFEIVR
jgi:hypothetical protein